jgi:hypothetical protein
MPHAPLPPKLLAPVLRRVGTVASVCAALRALAATATK